LFCGIGVIMESREIPGCVPGGPVASRVPEAEGCGFKSSAVLFAVASMELGRQTKVVLRLFTRSRMRQ